MSNLFDDKQPLIPLLADALAALLIFWLVPNLAQHFSHPNGLNALLVFTVYLLFCVAVFLLRKLEGEPVWHHRQLFVALAILAGIGMMLFFSQQFGYLDLIFTDPYSLGEGGAAAFFVFAPGAWLGVSLLYIPVLAFTMAPVVPPRTSRYLWQSFYGLTAVNGLMLLATAQLKALATAGGVGYFLLALLLLTLWFGPPRWLYWQKQPALSLEKRPFPLTLITFGLLILLCSWQIIA